MTCHDAAARGHDGDCVPAALAAAGRGDPALLLRGEPHPDPLLRLPLRGDGVSSGSGSGVRCTLRAAHAQVRPRAAEPVPAGHAAAALPRRHLGPHHRAHRAGAGRCAAK